VRTDIVPKGNDVRPATAADSGLSRKAIHDARAIRDAEAAEPGIVRATLDELIEAGEEPTKAALKERIVNRTSFTEHRPCRECHQQRQRRN
jgi:hypothetical protein